MAPETIFLINSVKQTRSWIANRHSASQEIRILCNLKIHCSDHNSPPLHSTTLDPISIRSILILSSHLHLDLPSSVSPSYFSCTCYIPRPSHLPLFHHHNNDILLKFCTPKQPMAGTPPEGYLDDYILDPRPRSI